MDTKNVIATLSQNLLDEVKKIMKKEKAEKSEKGESEADEKREHCSEALKGDQHKIDANKNGKVDAHDFHLLRKKKKKVAETYTALKNGEEISEEEVEEAVKEPYAVGMAAAMKATGDKPPLKKSTIMKAHKIAKKIKEDTEEVSEDAEQIDELSTKKLSDYRNKSLSNLEKREKKLKDGLGHGLRMTGSDDEERKIANRVSGIHTSSAKLKAKTGKYNPHPTVGQRIKKALKIEEVELTQEEVEQIDEISAGLARRAADKAYDLGAAERRKTRGNDASPLEKKRNIQGRNFDRYANKKEMANEQAEQIDELSPKTLGSYVKRASTQAFGKGYTGGSMMVRGDMNRDKEEENIGKKTVDKGVRRLAGISKATDKLTKEEQEFIDSLNAMELDEGRGRPPKEGSEAWKKRQAEGAAAADEPRQHPIQQLERIKRDMRGGGDFLHKDGSTHHVKGGDAAKLLDKYHGLKPAEKEDMQREIHGSHAGLKKHL